VKRWSRAPRAIAGLVFVVVAGCGTNDSATPADRDFVAAMASHHRLGIALVKQAETRAKSVELRRLVFEMHGYHHHEHSVLERWADDWKVEPAKTFPGEIPEVRLRELDFTIGIEFDLLWLTTMIEHHEGAIAISQRALESVLGKEVERLALSTIDVQSAEIVRMRDLVQTFNSEFQDS
jgi:uncharacterized protein (DUF305 family)